MLITIAFICLNLTQQMFNADNSETQKSQRDTEVGLVSQQCIWFRP